MVADGQGVHLGRCNNLPQIPAKQNPRNGSKQGGHRPTVRDSGEQVQGTERSEPGACRNHFQGTAKQRNPP